LRRVPGGEPQGPGERSRRRSRPGARRFPGSRPAAGPAHPEYRCGRLADAGLPARDRQVEGSRRRCSDPGEGRGRRLLRPPVDGTAHRRRRRHSPSPARHGRGSSFIPAPWRHPHRRPARSGAQRVSTQGFRTKWAPTRGIT
jgi:hypothetical protein